MFALETGASGVDGTGGSGGVGWEALFCLNLLAGDVKKLGESARLRFLPCSSPSTSSTMSPG